jgi:dihydrofolate reductase
LGDPDGIRSGHPAVVFDVVVDAVKQVTAFLVDGPEFKDGPELQVHGSGNLIQRLVRHNLVDQYRLWVFPLVISSGKRLFSDGTIPRR